MCGNKYGAFHPGIIGLNICAFSVLAAPTVIIFTNKADYQLSDTVLFSVSLSDPSKPHGGGLNIRFNQDVLQALSVVIDNVWSSASRPGVYNNAGGGIADILFASINTMEGSIGIWIIQTAVVGYGDKGFFVTESAKNSFTDASGQVDTFGIFYLHLMYRLFDRKRKKHKNKR